MDQRSLPSILIFQTEGASDLAPEQERRAEGGSALRRHRIFQPEGILPRPAREKRSSLVKADERVP
jgi:hypothetical protein